MRRCPSRYLSLAEPVGDRAEAALVALLGLLVPLLVALQPVTDGAQRLVELLGVLVPARHQRLEGAVRLALPHAGQRFELRAELAETALDLLVDVVHLLRRVTHRLDVGLVTARGHALSSTRSERLHTSRSTSPACYPTRHGRRRLRAGRIANGA